MLQYRCAWVILCIVGEVIIFENGCYIAFLKHTRMLTLSLLARNIICSADQFSILENFV